MNKIPASITSYRWRSWLVMMVLVMALGVLMTGCPTPSPTPKPTSTVTTPGGSIGISATPNPGNPGKDVNYIDPGKVEIGNLTPGATGEFELEVHNGGDQAKLFTVTVREPDYVADGFERLPKEYFGWVHIAETTMNLGPKESRKLLVAVTMPNGVSYSKKKAEIWVSVKEASAQAPVALQIELACRVLITTG